MNWKAWVPLAVAVVLGLVAAKVAMDMTAKKSTDTPASKGTQIVVAKQQIPPGQILRDGDLVLAPLASEQVPEGAFTNASELIGRVAQAELLKGQPVLSGLLAAPGAGGGLQALVPEGMRAITIEVNEFSSVAGLITPGCHVDVIASVNDALSESMVACTIVQNVRVQAVGQRVGSPAPKAGDKDTPGAGAPPPADQQQPYRSITLIVTPQEAEAIELASMTGRPRLVLRGNGDTADANTTGVSVPELVGKHTAARSTTEPSSDPFAEATPGKRHQEQVEAPPATQPVVEDPFIERHITVIRGAAETNATIKIPREPDKTLEGASADPSPVRN